MVIRIATNDEAMRRAARWTCVQGMPHRCMFLAGVLCIFGREAIGCVGSRPCVSSSLNSVERDCAGACAGIERRPVAFRLLPTFPQLGEVRDFQH